MNHLCSWYAKYMSKDTVSTFLSSGEGFSYEDHVGAFYLFSLLTDSQIYGRQNYKITKVSFQQQNQGNPLDDFVIEGNNAIQQTKLSLQAKHNITFGDNEKFKKVIMNSIALFQDSKFNIDIDKLGIIVGVCNRNIDQYYRRVFEIARHTCCSTDFENTINKESGTISNFYKLINNTLLSEGIESNDKRWEFFKSFVILYFQHGEESSLSYITLNQIGSLVEDVKDRNSIYSTLLKITQENRNTGGSVDKNALLTQLHENGINIDVKFAKTINEDLIKIKNFGNITLRNIGTEIKGIEADRSEYINQIEQSFEQNNIIMLTGTEGTGKSALLKNIVNKYINNKNCIIFSDKSLSFFNDGGWQGFSNYLKLENSIEDILFSLISNNQDIYLFVDGIDYITSIEKQEIIKAIVAQLQKMKETISLNFKILVTARLNSKPEWLLEFFQDNEYDIINIEFNPDENAEFIKNLNINKSLTINSKRFKPIFSNLFILNIFSNIENPENIYTEWDVVRLWWNKYIENSEKRQVLLNFSKKMIESPEKWQQINNINIANDLIENYILIKNEYESFYTTHDIYRDWLIALAIDQSYVDECNNFKIFLQSLDNVYTNYFIKPIAIFASKLITEDKYKEWEDLYNWASENNLLMVKQGFLESILSASNNIGKLYKFLNNFIDNRDLLKYILKYLYSSKIELKNEHVFINYYTFRPFIIWLSCNAKKLDIFDEIHQIFSLWRYCYLLIGNCYFSKIAEVYNYWLSCSRDKYRDPAKHHYVWYKENEILRELIFLSLYKSEYIEHELKTKYEHHDLVDVFLVGKCAEILIDNYPKEYSDFIFRNTTYSLDDLNERNKNWLYHVSRDENAPYMFEDNILDDYSSCKTYLSGPFSYFLEKEESIAINLIQKLTNHSINGLIHNEYLSSDEKISIELFGEVFDFYGDSKSYYWFRPSILNPTILNLAYISLENYIRNKIISGGSLDKLLKKLVSREYKNAVTLLGIAISIVSEFYNQTSENTIAIATNPKIWTYDIYRQLSDEEMKSFGTYCTKLTKEEKEAFEENKNRENRKFNVRDNYISKLLADDNYRNIVLNSSVVWDEKIDSSIPYYKLQLKMFDCIIRGDYEQAENYKKEIETLQSNDPKKQLNKINSWYIAIGLTKNEDIKNASEEELKDVFNYIDITIDNVLQDSMLLSSLLKFLLQLFIYKFKTINSINKYDFCCSLIYKIVGQDKSNWDSTNISSIVNSIIGLLSVKLCNEFSNHDKNDIRLLFELISMSILRSFGYSNTFSTQVLFDTLNQMPIRGKYYNLYVNLINFALEASILKRNLYYLSNSDKDKYINKNLNSLIKKYSKLKYRNLNKIHKIKLDNTVSEEILPCINFLSRHFKYFSKADKNFTKIYEQNIEKILLWNITLSKNGYEERRHSQEYKDWYTNLYNPIFNIMNQYQPSTYEKFINILVENKKYIPYLLEEFLFNFFKTEIINNEKYINILKTIFNKILESEKVETSTAKNYIQLIVLCSYGHKMVECDWNYFSEFKDIINKWVAIYGGTWHYYIIFLYFIKNYHNCYSIEQILIWWESIINNGEIKYNRLFENYGEDTLIILKMFCSEHKDEIQKSDLKRIIIDILNKLTVCNISGASEFRQSII